MTENEKVGFMIAELLKKDMYVNITKKLVAMKGELVVVDIIFGRNDMNQALYVATGADKNLFDAFLQALDNVVDKTSLDRRNAESKISTIDDFVQHSMEIVRSVIPEMKE